MGSLFEGLAAAARAVAHALGEVVRYPLQPGQRIYWLYLLSAALFVAWVYVRRARPTSEGGCGARVALSWQEFWRFAFPREVWSRPSAWLDVRYFFFHQPLRFFLYGGLTLGVSGLAFAAVFALAHGRAPQAGDLRLDIDASAGWTLAYVLGTALVVDAVSFGMHWWQHRSPLLWEFHKVHHSLEVMHPLSNYREHPVDNLLYAVGTGAATGGFMGLVHLLAGGVPAQPTVLGIGVTAFAFNFLAYNLRHSHVWLCWRPAWLNRWLCCPAHHQVHHSSHPAHIDKNFGFQFAFWDVLAGTYLLPKDGSDIRYGLDTGEERDYRTCLGLYAVPFRKLWGAARRDMGAHKGLMG